MTKIQKDPASERYIRANALAHMLDLSLSSVYRLESEGRIPKGIKLIDGQKGSKRWKLSDIEAWLNTRELVNLEVA